MTICPIAIAVGCEKCPAFKFCPLTTVLGDQQEEEDEYQRYAEEELEKNTKQMESFKGEDAEVIPERNKMKKAILALLSATLLISVTWLHCNLIMLSLLILI